MTSAWTRSGRSCKRSAGSSGMSTEEAAAAETLAISCPDSKGQIEQRILLQLGGLGLSERQRIEATRLSVLLARVLGKDAPVTVDGVLQKKRYKAQLLQAGKKPQRRQVGRAKRFRRPRRLRSRQ